MSGSFIRVLIAVSITVVVAGVQSAAAQTSRQQRNDNLNAGARMAQPKKRVEVTPNTMGGYNVRQGHQYLGTVKPDGNGGYRYEESYPQRNLLQTPPIK